MKSRTSMLLNLIIVLAMALAAWPLGAKAAPVVDEAAPVSAMESAAGLAAPIVYGPVVPKLSRAVRDLPTAVPEKGQREIPQRGYKAPVISRPGIVDALAAHGVSQGLTPAPLFDFEAQGDFNLYSPPDTVGDVGPNHYVQMVNVTFAIYDKAGNLLTGPTNNNALWAGTGGNCETDNSGDPIVIYDDMADRWVLSQFAVSTGLDECFAVSQTPDPTGAYYLYEFGPLPDFPDYPKIGAWPDAYYMGTNSGFPNAYYAHAFERPAMLTGAPALGVSFGGNPNMMLPADMDGQNPPPAGAPGTFYTYLTDQATGHPPGPDRLALYELDPDWVTPANSTFVLAQEIPIAPFNYTICGFFAGGCIPQPGTGQLLDDIAWWPMFRLQYRNLNQYEALVGNFTVDVDNTGWAGIRWFELQRQGANPWTLNQEGTYAPDGDHRWMGSIAIDGSGNVALGYSVSSGTTRPAIRYATRNRTDPLGTLQAEQSIIEGGGSQTGTHRWGDYSAMSVDPVDQCTFWYTTEYHDVDDAGFSWNTRVGVFRVPGCTGSIGATGVLSGTVTDANTSAPIPGADVSATLVPSPTISFATTTDGSGDYSMTVNTGTYTATASTFGYFSQTFTGVSVVSGTTTIRDFDLTPAPSAIISGTVTDATTGWPLYASIDVVGTPVGPVWNDPVTGWYSVTLPEGATYTFDVNAWAPGYLAGGRDVTVTGDATEDFGLDADPSTCIAPGYSGGFFDGFESGSLGASWTISTTANGRVQVSTSDPYEGLYSALLDTDPSGPLSAAAIILTRDLSSVMTPTLDFWWREYGDENHPEDGVFISDDAGATWCAVLSFNDGPSTYRNDVIDLTSAATGCSMTLNANFQIKFQGYDNFPIPSDGYSIDNVRVTGECTPNPGGLVIGNVYDDNTGLALDGATVENEDGYATSTWPTPADAALDDGFYTLFSPQGSKAFTATLAGYGPDAVNVTVVQSDTVGQDFYLLAGWIVPDPTAVSVSVELGNTASQPLDLDNVGGISATFEFQERDRGFVPTLGPSDPFGYSVWDSSEPDGPEYDFADISGTGTPVSLSDDSSAGPFPLGFTFNFYGVDYTDYYIGSNGFLSFGSGSSSLSNQCPLPNASAPNNVIAMHWDDLNPSAGGTVYRESFADCPFAGGACEIVMFDDVPHFGGSSAGVFEAILFENGSVLTQYADPGAELGSSATTGIEDAAGTVGLTYATCNSSYLTADLAVCFAYPGEATDCTGGDVPWLSTSPVTGTIAALGTQLVAVGFDASVPEVTQPGDYLATLKVKNDTPYGPIEVPVTMTVTAPASYGKLEGTVTSLGYCDANPAPVGDQDLLVEATGGMSWTLTTDVAGAYQLWLDEMYSPITVTVAPPEHEVGQATGVVIAGGVTTTQDFDLRWLKPCVGVTPDSLSAVLDLGANTTLPITITNSGAVSTPFDLLERDRGFMPALAEDIGTAWEVMAPLPSARVFNAVVAEGDYVYVIGGTSDAGGSTPTDTVFRYNTSTDSWDTMTSMPTALSSIDGIAIGGKIYIPGDDVDANTYVYNIAGDSWSVITANGGYTARAQYQVVAMGTNLYVLGGIAAGASTTEVWVLNTTTGNWSAGVPMQNSRTSFSAAAIGGDIYVAGGVAFPGFTPDMTSEMFDGVSWSYVANVPDGGGAYTRWSYNADGHGQDGLWLGAGRRDAGWAVLDHAGYYDPDADSWTDSPTIPILNQGRVYMEGDVAPDGYFYVIGGRNSAGSIVYADNERLMVGYAGGADVPWLSEDPISGTVPADTGLVTVDVTLDAGAVTQPGEYYATLNVASDDPVISPYGVAVTMTVSAPPTYGKLEGTVEGLGYCDANPTPLEGADVLVEAAGGMSWTLTTDISGTYGIWLDEGDSPFSVTASAANHVPTTVTGVVVTGMQTTVVDLDLRETVPCGSVSPDSFDVTVGLGVTHTEQLNIFNYGAGYLPDGMMFSISEITGPLASLVTLLPAAPAANAASYGDATAFSDAVTAFGDGATTDSLGPVTSPSAPDADVTLILDDGSRENAIGLIAGGQFIWLNRFTPNPADFPFTLTEVQMYFGATDNVNVGETLDIHIYADTDGDGDPGTGAVHLGGENGVQVQVLDDWSAWTLDPPVVLHGPGDVLVLAVNRTAGTDPNEFPAALDQTASQGRSWIGIYAAGDPPDPPPLPADSAWGVVDGFGFPGNWMVRGYGQTGVVGPSDVPWLSQDPITGTVPASTVLGVPGVRAVDVNFHAFITLTLEPTYPIFTATLVIDTDDPVSPTLYVPVTMTVEALPPVAGFTSNDPIYLGSFARFTNTTQATPPVTAWLWDFGANATPATSVFGTPLPVVYSTAGERTVSLMATNMEGSDTYTDTFTVCSVPLTGAAYTHTDPVVGQPVTFTAVLTPAGVVPTPLVEWSFGATGMQATTTFMQPGRQGVTVTATNACDQVSFTDWVTPTVPAAPVLTINKTVDPVRQQPGNPVAYTIVFGNVGNAAATGVTVSDALPSEVSYAWSTPMGSYNAAAHELVWANLTLAAGGRITATLGVTTSASITTNTRITNTVYLFSDMEPLMAQVGHTVELLRMYLPLVVRNN